MRKRGDSQRRAVTMYPPDWEVVEREAKRDDTSVSAALRRIVREWKNDRTPAVFTELIAEETDSLDELAGRIWGLVEQRAKQSQEETAR